ncbi:site-specific tyrosine recombinase/integron integrase [Ligilactobacillus acidipiscis]|uniref:Type I restriction-modification system, specificity subunit S n=1 Tax=Ligilactobacillus acidipiscis TaxID=89059 RepID=A0A1K1KLA4_9LACO|nr:site-specific tyrosine recombinase/integron integrase [Ligilactobacillus acidipiscis]SFV39637.1 Type I restriction-modification system, specificity subunit S [Ligilactobacillus acidipiscis]
MSEKIVNKIIQEMLQVLDNQQLIKLKKCLDKNLNADDGDSDQDLNNEILLQRYFSAKRTEGCSERSLAYYKKTIEKLTDDLKILVIKITTDDLRKYLTDYQIKHHSSKVTIDNIRRILSSFFNWLEDEDYIIKSPVRRIHKIKTRTTVKETYSDEELECLRDNCSQIRDLAMIDMLASTGMRVGELVRLNIDDINFLERECVVLGKGNKERITYFDARSKLHLQSYLDSRSDSNSALFVSLKNPKSRLTIGGIESRLKYLGNKSGILKVYPHKFRRTLATVAIDKGMPIEQLQELLGHKRIDTTLHYAMVKQQNVKLAHRRYIG